MTHLTEEELILHYYGEEDGDALAAERHLEACQNCRAVYSSLQRVLNVVDALPVPERGPEYEGQLWARLRTGLPRRRVLWPAWNPSWRWAAVATACAALMALAFVAGRSWPARVPAASLASKADPQTGERVLLVAVGDYLERSQMVLIELSNANPGHPLDISSEQERAADLVSESRLYRQTAVHTGDTAVAGLLDELDRVLLEITHAPSALSAAQVDELRQRLQAQGILFKIRVLGTKVRQQENSAAGTGSAPHEKL